MDFQGKGKVHPCAGYYVLTLPVLIKKRISLRDTEESWMVAGNNKGVLVVLDYSVLE